jgi:hypothetical protein
MTSKIANSLKIVAAATALAIAGAALPGVTAPAEAKKLVFIKKGFHPHFHHRHYGRYIGSGLVIAGAYGASRSCYWMKVRAINTGSDYWWDRYNECRGE